MLSSFTLSRRIATPGRVSQAGGVPVVIKSALLCSLGILLGCAAPASSNGAAPGYVYQDANHPGGVAQASPQALHNAAHGVWLWPPQSTDWP